MAESRQDIRKDLMRRWFAVAISVGFAATLVEMDWINDAEFPRGDELQQIARLITALIAVVLSWEGYFFSIESKPLKSTSRFAIDFVLVLTYMLLLYTSKVPYFWLYLHAISFVLYVVWDLLSIAEYRTSYSYGGTTESRSTGALYLGGVLDKSGVYKGPIITLSWAVYFILLAASQLYFGPRNSFVLAPFAIAGLLLYRWDKTKASNEAHGAGASLEMWKRALIIVGLLVALSLACAIFTDHAVTTLSRCLSS